MPSFPIFTLIGTAAAPGCRCGSRPGLRGRLRWRSGQFPSGMNGFKSDLNVFSLKMMFFNFHLNRFKLDLNCFIFEGSKFKLEMNRFKSELNKFFSNMNRFKSKLNKFKSALNRFPPKVNPFISDLNSPHSGPGTPRPHPCAPRIGVGCAPLNHDTAFCHHRPYPCRQDSLLPELLK